MFLQPSAGSIGARWFPGALLLLTSWSWAADSQSTNASLADRLARLRQQYQAVSSVQFRMNSTLSASTPANPQEERVMRGSCQYWGSQGNYRMDTKLEPARSAATESVIAYDGARWQYFEQQASRLIYKKANDNRQPMCLPNPLLLPLAFVRPPAGEKGVKLLWAEAQSDAFWKNLDNAMQLVAVTNPPEGLTAEYRGRLEDGTAFTSRIRFGSQPDYLPTQIEWIPEKSVAIRYVLEQYERHEIEGRASYWPRQVRMELSDPTDKTTGQWATTVEELKLNARVPADVFTLDFTKPAIIYDDDLQAFVKTRGGYRVSPTVTALEGPVEVDVPAAGVSSSSRRPTDASPQVRTDAGQTCKAPPPATPLADVRYRGLRWAGMSFTGLGVLLVIAYLRWRRAGTANSN